MVAYENGWKDSLADAHAEVLRQANAKRGETVLDMACGTGLVTLPIAEAVGPFGHVLASDLSQSMVDELKDTTQRLGMPNVTTFRADAEDLSALPDESVDLVTCALGLMYVPNPQKALSEAWRVLKPGGRAVMAVWGERSNCGWAEIFPIVDSRVETDVCPLFFRLGTGQTLSREMSNIGFSVTQCNRLTSELSYADDATAINAAFVGGPVALAYDRFDVETRLSAAREYLASISDFQTPNGYRIPGEFVVCTGYKEANK